MKKLVQTLVLSLIVFACSTSESVFLLGPQQGMLIVGKGPGQDAAINPYAEVKSIAIVKSLSENPFEIRVQFKDTVIKTVEVLEGEKKEITLLQGYQLYLDSELASKAQVKFRPF